MKNFFPFFALVSILCGSITSTGQNAVREIKILKGQKYLNFPIREADKITRAKVGVAGKVIDEFTIKLTAEKPDYWVFLDVSLYAGRTIKVEVSGFNDREGVAEKALQMVFAAAMFPGQDSVYKEKGRLQAHFSARRGWLNDPNGLLYHNGEYHLYFQHNPYGWDWGNMHWGHAVSKDLLHWQELPEALYPVNNSDMAFSGSAVVDTKNTSGFRRNGIDPVIAFYTSTGRGECMKLSYDSGRTFTEYEHNPLIKHKGRDPKVFWYEPGSLWVMVVWDEEKVKPGSTGKEAVFYQHLIYTSPDLKSWTYQSGVPGFFECGELFQLPVDGHEENTKWVMYDATGRYAIGNFDGKKFSATQQMKQYDYGGYFYASQTYNNAPGNRRIQVGWGRGIAQPGMPFNQAMLFPTQLKLKNAFDGLRLCPTPIEEISMLHQNSQTFENKVLTHQTPVVATVNNTNAIHVIAEFEKGDAIPIGLNILGAEISFNDLVGELFVKPGGESEPVKNIYSRPGIERFKIEVIADKNMLEIFINDGDLYYVLPLYGNRAGKVEAFSRDGGDKKAILKKMEIHELKSIWENWQ